MKTQYTKGWREPAVAESARIVDILPILGRMIREGGNITYIEHPYNSSDVDLARGLGVDVAWEWCRSPMSGIRQGELVRIWIGTRDTGPLLQWDNSPEGGRWRRLTDARGYGGNWACGGRWSCMDKEGSDTLLEAIRALPDHVRDQVAAALFGRLRLGRKPRAQARDSEADEFARKLLGNFHY